MASLFRDWVGIQFSEQWSGIFVPWRVNWVDFTLINLSAEYDKAGPQIEITVGLLGFALFVAIHLPWNTEQSVRLESAVQEAKTAIAAGQVYGFPSDSSAEEDSQHE